MEIIRGLVSYLKIEGVLLFCFVGSTVSQKRCRFVQTHLFPFLRDFRGVKAIRTNGTLLLAHHVVFF